MSDMRKMSQKERDATYKAVTKALHAVEKQHGEDVVRWAFNKQTAERRERRKLQEVKRELEERLAAMEKV